MSQKRASNGKTKNLRQSRLRRRTGQRGDADQSIARINILSRTARATWLGLLSFLAFVGVTLMGVRDAEFFLPEIGTELPLIGVSVPTYLFFFLAPALGTALFGYLHFQLLSLWQALGSADESHKGVPLSDHVTPWLINDLALGLRRDGALREQPMRRLSALATGILVFLATPAVLIAFWWRSMPAHDEVLTVLAIGVPLTLALYIAARSWSHLRREARRSGQIEAPRRHIYGLLVVATVIATFGWFRTEGTLGWHAETIFQQDPDWLADRSWAQTPFPLFLARADLANVDFVGLPVDWQDREEDRVTFFLSFCANEGIPQLACGAHDARGDIEAEALAASRARWCRDELGENISCESYFSEITTRRAKAWKADRARRTGNLPIRDFRRTDLRNAYLRNARLEAANLTSARLQGANLVMARLEGANLTSARLDRSNLTLARLEEANLTRAPLEEADLTLARLEGADLSMARLVGAKLVWARFDRSTRFFAANTTRAVLSDVNLTAVNISVEQMASMFGDGSVVLPDNIPRPAHWPSAELHWVGSQGEWNRWRLDPTTYVPPQHRD